MNKETIKMDLYQSFIHLSRYSRWLYDKKRRESWEETVTRYMDFFKEHLEQNCKYKMSKNIYDEVKDYILSLKVLPSMRALMTAGEALKRDNLCNFNCSFLHADRVRAFDEMLYVLLNGVGVGFSVERQFVQKLPTMSEEFTDTDTTIIVHDSKMGWAKAYKELISLLLAGQIPKWDMNRVRPAGARLKVFGGRSSGPAPLDELFKFTVIIFKEAIGRNLTSFEVHKLFCKIADVVVVGGVRRASLISLSNLSDDRMRHAKSGQWWVESPELALSNNSACYTEKPDIGIFMEEWLALYNSKSGERGIFNRQAAIKSIKKINKRAGKERRSIDHEMGINPCFTGDMKLLTSKGYQSLEDLELKSYIDIINPETGENSQGSVWSSGIKSVYEIVFHNKVRSNITCTKDHIFKTTDGYDKKAEDLIGHRIMPYIIIKDTWVKNDFLAGFIQGDGCTGRLNSSKHKGLEVNFGQKDKDIAEMYNTTCGEWYSREAKKIAEDWKLSPNPLPTRDLPNHKIFGSHFISGLYSANGSVVKKYRVSFKTSNINLANKLKKILYNEFDINSFITTNKSKKVSFKNGDYICKESYNLEINTFKSIKKFAKSISFGQKYKRDTLKELIKLKAPKVRTVKYIGKQEVYDFNEPEGNYGVIEGVIAHNCAEIILKSKSCCNLSEVIIRSTDTFNDLKEKIRIATILGTWQASLTDFKYVSSKWKENCEEEALLGVSMTGIMDNSLTNGSEDKDKLIKILNELRDYATEINKEWSKKIGINEAAAITCVKPSGNVSQLVNSSSGIHARHSEYYIRSVRVSKKDPISHFMISKGFPYELDITKPDSTVIFKFPIKSPKGSITRTDKTAIEQLELWMIYKEHYCDHNVSQTINIREHEWLEVGSWVYKNFDEISGVAFLPFSEHSYKQAPYQECTKEEYEIKLKEMPKNIDWNELSKFESEDNTTSSQELSCTSGNCEI